MGYPMGMFESSIKVEEMTKSPKRTLDLNRMSRTIKNALSGFGIYRDLNFKTQSDVLQHKEIMDSLIQVEFKKKSKSDIPKGMDSYNAFEDEEVSINVSSFTPIFKGKRNYSVCVDDMEQLMSDFEKL